jgi:hypothetical protein
MYKKTRRLSIEHARIARKASFWQPKYDEWKKYGVECPNFTLSEIMSDDLLQGYMDKGWDKIIEIYKKKLSYKSNNRSPKSKILHDFETKPVEEEELIISILGSIRKFIIKTTFKSITKSINDLNEILTVGSNNITSDFDITILGPNANTIMWKMFISFLAKFEDSLPEAFDSNLYCSPLYIYENINHDNIICKNKNILPQRIDYKYRNFTLVPFTEEDLITELNWACIKLLDLNLQFPHFLNRYINEAKKYKIILDKITNDTDYDEKYRDISLQNNLHPSNKFNKDTITTIKNYYLQWKYQKPIQQYIYSNDNENLKYYEELITLPGNNKPETNIFFYSNIPNYFSSDAYYTSSSVNSVVINTQMNIQFNMINRSEKIKNGVYIVSAIENFGDMVRKLKKASDELEINNKEMNEKINTIKTIIIKNSKYLFRIFNDLIKAGNVDLIEINNEIKNKVIPFRETYNIKKANELNIFKYVYYNNQDNIIDYINILQKIIITEISLLINKNNL